MKSLQPQTFYFVVTLYFVVTTVCIKNNVTQISALSSSTAIPNWIKNTTSMEFPIFTSGSGTAMVPIRLGDPPQTHYLFPDTGSYGTWTNCTSLTNTQTQMQEPLKLPLSRTFSPLHCSVSLSSSLCTNKCYPPFSLCEFKHIYGDGTTASGFWAKETATVDLNNGQTVKIPDVVFGCSSSPSPDLENADGILGLFPHFPSFTSRLPRRFAEKFSFCIPGAVNSNGFLVFGENPARKPVSLEYTKLEYRKDTLFFVEVAGISIDGIRLDIPEFLWKFDRRDGSGGVFLDTGTTFSFFPEIAFSQIHSAFADFFRDYDDVRITSSNICFNSSAPEFEGAVFPQLTIEFRDGAMFNPRPENYFYGYSEDNGMKCLAFHEVERSTGSIMGVLLQSDFYWEYDLASDRLGFAPARCS